MRKIRVTEEFRVETEEEAKAIVERYQKEGSEKGFSVKKSKGEIIDSGYLLKITSQFFDFWGE